MDLPEPDDRLNSWKEVAAFLGRTTRTVQRWEQHEGLPLRRGGPGQRGAVLGSKREIGEWWERRRLSGRGDGAAAAVAETTRPLGLRAFGFLAAGLAALAVAVVAALPALRRTGATTEIPAGTGRLLAASTSEGRTFVSIPLNAVASDVTLSPSGRLAFVAMPGEHAVTVVDIASRRIIDSYDVIDQPHRVIVGPDEDRLFVAGSSELGIVDLRRRTLTRFNPGGSVTDVHVSRDGRHVWIALAQAGLRVLDLRRARWDTIATVGCPMHMTFGPQSGRLFVAYQCGGPGGRPGHDAIEIMDEAARSPITASAGPPLVGTRLALSPDEQHLWADANDACVSADYDRSGCPAGRGPVLHAFRAATLEHLLTVRIAGDRGDSRPIFVPDGTRLLLGGFDLTVIDRALGTVYESIDRESGFGAFTPDGKQFVALDMGRENRALLVLDVAPPLDAGLMRGVATHWSGDGTANDIIGGTHGTAAGELRFAPGRYGQAFSFDERWNGPSFGRRLDADIALGPATYAAWIKTNTRGEPLHIASRTSAQSWSWSITAEGRLAFCLAHTHASPSCATQVVGRTTMPSNRWHHVAVVRSASALMLYVDGREDASIWIDRSGQPVSLPDAGRMLRLGAGPNGVAPFRGLIDEVLLFERALSAAELLRVMRMTSLPVP